MHVKRPVLSHVRMLAVAAVLVPLAACGSATSGSPSGSGKDGAANQPAAEQVDKVLFDTDFEGVCAGAPQKGAAAYDQTTAGIHPVLGFGSRPYEADAAKLSPLDIPEGFSRKWAQGQNNLAEIQLVVCAKRTTDTVVKKCDGYKKDNKPTGQVVTLHSTAYDVKVYAARTGEEVAAKTFDAPGKECPMFALSGQTDEYPEIDEQVVAFIQPFVKTA
jgi:hypothetical protein